MSDVPQQGGTSTPPKNQDEVDTLKPEAKPTLSPAATRYLSIRILCEHEHMRRLADTMRLFLETRTYADRTPVTSLKVGLPDPVTEIERQNPSAFRDTTVDIDIVIVMIDEFTELDQLMESVDFYYSDKAQIVAHTEYPNEEMQEKLVKAGVYSIAFGWDFKPLADQIDQLARKGGN